MSETPTSPPPVVSSVLLRILAESPDRPPVEGLLRQAEAGWELGLGERAREAVDQARAQLVREGPREALARANLWLARIELWFGDAQRAEVALQKAADVIGEGRTKVDQLLLAVVRLEQGWLLGQPAPHGSMAELVAAACDVGERRLAAWIRLQEGLYASGNDDIESARRIATDLLALPEDDRQGPLLSWCAHALLAHDPHHRGAASRDLDALLEPLPQDVRERFLARRDRAMLLPRLDGTSFDASRRLRLVSRVVRAVISEPQTDRLLRLIVDSLVESCQADSGLLVLLRPTEVELRVRRGAGGRDLSSEDVPFSSSIARRVAERGESLLLADASSDPEWKSTPSVSECTLTSVLCVPLRSRERSMGAVFLESRRRSGAFGHNELELGEILADQAAIALENAMLQERTRTDALTGMATHPHFSERLHEEVARSRRYARPCSLLLVDLDRFKAVNDTHGHDVGSHLLKQVALLLRETLRTSDVTGRPRAQGSVLGRYGGDEFEILLPETDGGGMARAADRILAAVRALRFQVGDHTLQIQASLGGAVFPEDARDETQLFLRADEALYEAKNEGRNRFHAFVPSRSSDRGRREVSELLLTKYGPEVASLFARAFDAKDATQPLMDQALQVAVRVTGADRGFLLLFEGPERVRVRSAFNLAREDLAPERFRLSFGMITDLIRAGRPVRGEDPARHERFGQHASVVDLGLSSFLAVPIGGESGPLGLLYLDSTSPGKAFRPEDEALLTRFASMVGRALGFATASERAAFEIERLSTALGAGLKDLQAQYRYDALIGQSDAMRKLRESLDHIARTPYAVLVVGETGTGKELVARAIHANSPRKDAPLVAVNCAALPKELLEAELFGSVKGAFTGADRDRPGLVRAAHRGTLFLDEIGEMPADLQTRLLRVLQEGEVTPVGTTAPVKVDVRVIAATNRDVEEAVRRGGFREDLYYRLKVFKVALPPLRERSDDIPLLAATILERVLKETSGGRRTIHPSALDALRKHRWPGNVRELENAVRHAVAFSSDEIRPEHLPPEVTSAVVSILPEEIAQVVRAQDGQGPLDAAWSFIVRKTLEACDWNQSEAARQLGISRVTLKRKMEKYGLVRPSIQS